MTLDEMIMKLDLIASDAFEGGDANEFRQLAKWLKELKESRKIIDFFLQTFVDFDLDMCCEDLMNDGKEQFICEENCSNNTKACWLRWAKLKVREVNADEEGSDSE